MNFAIDLNSILILVLGGLLTWGIKGIFGMKDQLTKINGRMGKSEQWQDDHEKQDDERHDRTGEALTAVWNELGKIKKWK